MESIHARRIHSEESFPYVDFHVKLIMDFIIIFILCYFFDLFGWQFAQSFMFLNDHMTRPAFPACDFFDKQ